MICHQGKACGNSSSKWLNSYWMSTAQNSDILVSVQCWWQFGNTETSTHPWRRCSVTVALEVAWQLSMEINIFSVYNLVSSCMSWFSLKDLKIYICTKLHPQMFIEAVNFSWGEMSKLLFTLIIKHWWQNKINIPSKPSLANQWVYWTHKHIDRSRSDSKPAVPLLSLTSSWITTSRKSCAIESYF